jgi:translation initiation factor IF-1
MVKQEAIQKDAIVTETLPDARFRVKLEDSENIVLAYTSGRMRKFYIKIYPGDRVKLEMSPYDTTKARIVFRYKK